MDSGSDHEGLIASVDKFSQFQTIILVYKIFA
jgi:hypothetical protein